MTMVIVVDECVRGGGELETKVGKEGRLERKGREGWMAGKERSWFRFERRKTGKEGGVGRSEGGRK